MQSARLKFKTIKQEHWLLLFSLYTDVEVRKYLGGALDEMTAKQRADKLVKQPPTQHWVLQTLNGDFIGTLSLAKYYDNVTTEVSYTLLPQYWRFGYASEALIYIAKWAGENLSIDKIIAETQAANLPSRKLLEKRGFRPMGQVERFGQLQTIYQLNLLDLAYKNT